MAALSGGRRSLLCEVDVQYGDPITTRQTSITKVEESLDEFEYCQLLHALMAKYEPAP